MTEAFKVYIRQCWNRGAADDQSDLALVGAACQGELIADEDL
jgi:hypothetical protein